MKSSAVRTGFIFLSLVFVFVMATSDILAAPNSGESNGKCAMLNFEKAYKNAGAVFVGEVVEIKKDGNKRVFTFKIKKYWKGIEGKTIDVAAHENRRYQAPFEEGKSFLVFAKADEDGGFWDGRCSRTRNMESYAPSLKEDLEKLGEGKTADDEMKECEEGKSNEPLIGSSDG